VQPHQLPRRWVPHPTFSKKGDKNRKRKEIKKKKEKKEDGERKKK